MVLAAAGLYIGVATLGLFEYYLDQSYALASTMAFTTIVMTAQILALSFRSLYSPLSSIGWFSNPWILGAVLATTLMQAAALYVPFLQKILHTVPLSGMEWGAIFLVMIPLLGVPEVYKWLKQSRKFA